MISDDPYEPQEIHLSLTGMLCKVVMWVCYSLTRIQNVNFTLGHTTSMKVMWTTMEQLKNPVVEYTNTETMETSYEIAKDYTYKVKCLYSDSIYDTPIPILYKDKDNDNAT